MAGDSTDFFKGLKVVELASVLAGPSAGLFFAELGAEVIKVENSRTGGDVTRSWKLNTEDPSAAFSAYYFSVNLGKQSLLLDFRNKAELNKVKQLIADCDVLICNFKAGDAEKYALTYEVLVQQHPGLIYATVNGFGDADERVAYDLILQAESGFMSMNGTAESGPLKMPVALIDLLAGHQLKEGILLALMRRMKTGKGSSVCVSLFDAAIASLANQASNYLNAATVATRSGSLHPNIAPYGEIFTSKDAQAITFAIGNERQFEELTKLLAVHELASHPQFCSNQLRVKNRGNLFPLLQKAVSAMEAEQLYAACLQKKIPVARIKALDQVLSDAYVEQELLITEMKEGRVLKAPRSFIARLSINK